jgi:hypothetical protein
MPLTSVNALSIPINISNIVAINIAEKFMRCRIVSILRSNSYTGDHEEKNIVKLELKVRRTAP